MNDKYNYTLLQVQYVISTFKQFIKKMCITILNVLINNIKEFITFLFQKNIMQVCIGLIIASQFGVVVDAFTKDIIKPILDVVFSYNRNIGSVSYSLFGIKFKIGEFIITLINLIIALFCIFIISKLSQNNMIDRIIKFLTELKLKIE